MQYKTITNTHATLKPHTFSYFLLHVCEHVPVNTFPKTCHRVKRIFVSHQWKDTLHRSMFQVRVNFASPGWQLANLAGPLPVVRLSDVSPTLAISIQLQYTAQFRDSSHRAKYRTCLRLPCMPEIKLIHISYPFLQQQILQKKWRALDTLHSFTQILWTQDSSGVGRVA
jgi:hypothetical protein